MNPEGKPKKILDDPKVNIKIKLSVLWIVLMFFYLYNDVISFFRQDHVAEILTGEIAGIQITQEFLIGAAVLMAIPIFMVFLSLALPARINRPTNIIVGAFHAFLLVTSLIGPGEIWAHFGLYMVFEAVFIALIIWHAWKWPRLEASSSQSVKSEAQEQSAS